MKGTASNLILHNAKYEMHSEDPILNREFIDSNISLNFKPIDFFYIKKQKKTNVPSSVEIITRNFANKKELNGKN